MQQITLFLCLDIYPALLRPKRYWQEIWLSIGLLLYAGEGNLYIHQKRTEPRNMEQVFERGYYGIFKVG